MTASQPADGQPQSRNVTLLSEDASQQGAVKDIRRLSVYLEESLP